MSSTAGRLEYGVFRAYGDSLNTLAKHGGCHEPHSVWRSCRFRYRAVSGVCPHFRRQAARPKRYRAVIADSLPQTSRLLPTAELLPAPVRLLSKIGPHSGRSGQLYSVFSKGNIEPTGGLCRCRAIAALRPRGI